MRSAMFQSSISVNAQGAQMLFQGAESGIEGVLKYVVEEQIDKGVPLTEPGNLIFEVVSNSASYRLCIDGAGVVVPDGDAKLTVIDETSADISYDDCDPFPNMPVRVTTVLTPTPPGLPGDFTIEGFMLEQNECAATVTAKTLHSRAYADIPGLGMNASHVQLWSVMAPGC
jgi:hypothetical protein